MHYSKRILFGGVAILVFYKYASMRKNGMDSFISFLKQTFKKLIFKQSNCLFSKSGPADYSPDFGNENS